MTHIERIESPSGRTIAAFAPAANCVCCSLAHDGRELLGLRGGLSGYVDRGSTMGIPLLHPWANRLDLPIESPLVKHDANGLPIHGVLPSALRWDVAAGGQELRAKLDWTRDELLAVFPHRHRLTLHARVEDGALELATTLEAVGDEVPVSFGYHPYFALPDVPRGDWELELPRRRRMLLDDRGLPTGATDDDAAQAAPLGERTFDDAYDELGERPRFAVSGAGRRIEIEFGEGYPFAQVYAPAGEDLVALEPMTAPVNALATRDRLPVATPGRPYRARFTIRA